MKNQKGVNLVSLSVAVIVIIAIAGTVLYNVRTNLAVQRLKAMQADIENLRGKVANYYLQYGALPVLNVYSGGEKQVTWIPKDSSVLKDVLENAANDNLDTGDYYVLDLKSMENITLTYGKDYENLKDKSAETIQTLSNGTLTDVYIINSVSHNIFYVQGITYEGKNYYTQYQDEEENRLGDANLDIDINVKKINQKVLIEIKKGETAPNNRNAFYIDEKNHQAIIPAGFTVSATESSIENGLVVTDGSSNEWVWIPVSSEDFSAMFGTANDDGWTMSGTDVKTKYKANSAIIAGITRGNPGTTSYREPDVLNNDSYDKNTTNLSAAGLGSNISEMATNLRNDYKAMMDSVKKNGGFYVGRYEIGGSISETLVQKGKTVITNTNWYNLYKACKSFSKGNVEARMIWGCQWDQVCRFISTYKEGNETKTRSLTDSTTYGNYNNSSGNAKVVVDGQNKFGNKQVTGFSEYWKTNNIYDLAGNCWEWTQEAFSTGLRAYRGR